MTFLGNGRMNNASLNTCDEYRLEAIDSIEALFDACQQIAAQHPGCRPLLSLDDWPQARYTSGHARHQLDLDEVGPQDLDGLPAECFENGEHIGYLSTKAEFPICLRNFLRHAAHVSFDDACAHGLTLDEQALQAWSAYQQAPLTLLDQPLLALVVPVAQACEALAAFPNGYFESDLGPAQNFAVARHLADRHGYQLIGVGAAYLGLLRAEAADAAVAEAVAADLCRLYNVPEQEQAALSAAFVAAVDGRRHLWLRYVE